MSTTPPYLPQTLFGQKTLPGAIMYADSQGNLIADPTLTYDPTTGFRYQWGGISAFPVRKIFTSTAAATAVASSTTATTIIGAGTGTKTIPAGALAISNTIRVRGSGIIADTSTPNITVALLMGTTALCTTTTAAASTITGTTMFFYNMEVAIRTVTATASIYAQGTFTYFTTAPVSVDVQLLDQAATPDLTAAQTLDVQFTWGTSSASNTITGQTCTIEIL